jgi:predicted GNAT family acetyltransferase
MSAAICKGIVMPDIQIERTEAASKGRYIARVKGVEGVGELTYTRRQPNLFSADHTGAPETLRGTGAAMALVERLIADARTEGFKVIPICPYVAAQYKRHPEWADVMTESVS